MIMRKDVDPALTWDLSSIYKTEEDMYRDADRMKEMAEAIEKEYKGKLDSPERIARCMDLYREVYTLRNIIRRIPKCRAQTMPYLLFNFLYRKYGGFTERLCNMVGYSRIGALARRVSYLVG